MNYGMFLAFKVLIIGSLLVVGSLLVFNNALNVGQFVAMEIVVILSLTAVDKLILTTETMYDILTALEKLGSLTDLPLESERGEHLGNEPGTQGMGIAIKDLTLRFPDMRHPVISHATMTVKAGERVNLITTDDSFITHFFRLLTGFYDGYKGSITINGLPLQNLCIEDLRLHVGGYSTLQEIFDGSLLENITMGIEGVNLDRVLPIIKAVGLADFVEGEQDGLHAHLQTHGGTLPESIKRKIILARSLATHPSLLLLNQPFDGLDAIDKNGFLAYVREHLPTTTMIIATPDPLPQGLADRAFRIENHTVIAA
ncbi:MAG: ATP-binding cassette domain-containing protein [Bacteroidia bacterium]